MKFLSPDRRVIFLKRFPEILTPPKVLVAPQQRKQVELMAYRNAGKGAAHMSKGEVQCLAQAQLSSILVPADVPRGSSVAVKNARPWRMVRRPS